MEELTPTAPAAEEPRYRVVLYFQERENAEKAREQITWAMNRSNLIPFHMEIEEVDPHGD